MKQRSSRATPSRQKRILIVDDHSVVREGLRTVINQQKDLIVCGEAENAAAAVAGAAKLKPDAMIVDITLGTGRNGVDLIKDLRAQGERCPILALSMHDETLYAERALRAGAQGYVMKKESSQNVLAALRRVLAGEVHLSERMTAQVVSQRMFNKPVVPQSPLELLSDRELEVFQLLGQGQSTREIADKLHLSIKTISCYRQNIKAKLNLQSAAQLVSHAIHWAESQEAR